MKPNLSVIIPCYNLQNYLRPCLNSVLSTNFPHARLEIILVDDGSSDHTGDIIDRYAHRYKNVRGVHTKNRGISSARNLGMKLARGTYLAFADGDDIVPPNAYSKLMYLANHNRADIVAGFVRRFDQKRNHGSFLHKFAICDNENRTDIEHTPSLLYDTTVWNKVFRHRFITANHLRFIPHLLYEDLPFTLLSHLRSHCTSVATSTVYYWRWRPNSVTQSRNAIRNYSERLRALGICRKIMYNEHASTSLQKLFRQKVLKLDLPIFLENIGDAETRYVYRVQELTYCFLRNWKLINSPYLKRLPLKTQLLYYAIKTGNLALLTKYTYTKRVGRFKTNPITKKYRFEPYDLPKQIADHLDLSDNTLRTTQHLSSLKADPDTCSIFGHGMLRIRRMHLRKLPFATSNHHERLSAELVNIDNARHMPIYFHRRKTPYYKRILRPNGGWTNARYNLRFNYMKALQKLGTGRWTIMVHECIDSRYRADIPLGHPLHEGDATIVPVKIAHDIISNAFRPSWQLIFHARPVADIDRNFNTVAPFGIIGNRLVFRFSPAENASDNIKPIIKLNDLVIPGSINRHRIYFNISDWTTDMLDRTGRLILIDPQTNYHLKYRCRIDPNAPLYKSYPCHRYYELKVKLARYSLRIVYKHRSAVLYNYRLAPSRTALRLQVYLPADVRYNARTARIELLSTNLVHRYVYRLASVTDNVKSDRVTLAIPLLSHHQHQLNILKGHYHLRFYLPCGDAIHRISTAMSTKSMDDKVSIPLHAGDVAKLKIIAGKYGLMQIRIYQPYTGFDRKKSHRAIEYSVLYPLMRLLPLRRHTAVFDAYWGSQFSSNERALYQYMRIHYPHYRAVWFFKNRQTPITGDGTRVRTMTLKYWYYLATAKYLFQNTNLPNRYYKRKHQIETETLHGTFLKHMGFDEPHFRYASRRIQNNFARRNRRWDYLIVPSPYMKRTAGHAFDYHRAFLPYGFPRNDELVKHDNHKHIERIKQHLGIPLNKTVILYAPTYRKNNPQELPLDLKYLRDHLPKNYVILVRLHYFVAHTHSFYNCPGFVYDVSDYPDINDLYLVSDALVTDYSSVMFDYAYLDRPIIYYAFDRNWYLNDRIRGTYLKYDRLPGPIVSTEKQLAKVLSDLPAVRKKYHRAIRRFHYRFATYGNRGDASKRTLASVFNTKKSVLDQEPDRGIIFNKFWHWFKIRNLQSRLLNWLGSFLPRRNIVMFESFFGTQYSDNPKAIYLYFKRHCPRYKLYWNVKPQAVPYFKRHHIPYIRRFGYRGIFKQAQAKYWITNCRRPFRWKVPKHTILLQTWHGTPLKTLGADVNLVTMPGNNPLKYHRQVYNDNRRWNLLIIPNRYSLSIMPRAFRMQASQLMLTGYPRNDALVHPNQKRIRELKRKLGIRPWQKVVLYAPTWRDDEYVKSDEFTAHLHLDIGKIRSHFGNRVVVLVRTHYMIANQLDLTKYRGSAINVSDYPDIADLYLISDVLITDYSSVMFDYAILKRPIIFFDYDFNRYAHRTRGFYFDIARHAPGPIVKTTDQVVSQLGRIFAGRWHPNANYQRFVKRFASWMDGKSTKRVVHQLLYHDNTKAKRQYLNQLRSSAFVRLRDGAMLWNADYDFTKPWSVSRPDCAGNYDAEHRLRFRPLEVMHLQSKSFATDLSEPFVLVKANNHRPVWVAEHDIVKSSNS